MQTYTYNQLLEPPTGRVVHAMGQFPVGNQAYLDAIAPLGVVPAANPCFRSTFISIGTTKRQPTLAAFEAGMAQLTQWMLDGHLRAMSPHIDLDLRTTDATGAQTSTIRAINEGTYDAWIKAFGDTIATYARPVLLRIGGECTSPHERRLPDGSLIAAEEFIAAYRRIVGILNDTGARQFCALGWCIEVGSGDPDFKAFIPPISDVDFFAIDLFHPREFSGPTNASNEMAAAFAAFARESGRPLWICESSAIVPPAEQWGSWFVPLLDWIQAHGVVGWVYINHDWLGNPNGWLSGKIDGNADVVSRLRAEFAGETWMHAPGQVLLKGVKNMLTP